MPIDNTRHDERTAHDDVNRRRVLKAAAAGAASMVGVAGAATAGDGDDGVETESGCCLYCREYFCCDDLCDEMCYRCTCTCDDDGDLQ